MNRLFLFLFFVLPGVSFADVYKCVNQGKTIYSFTRCGFGSVPYDSSFSSSSVQLSRTANGTFLIDGVVNGSGVSFTVDTGASKTILSGSVAARLGIRACDKVAGVITSNGNADMCSFTAQNFLIAGFNFSHVKLYIIPSMTDGALLGSDMLSKFMLVQRGDFLTLSR